jgi:hypothetical protein
MDQLAAKVDSIITNRTDIQCANQICLLLMESKLDNYLQQSDMTKHVNKDLLMAYHATREENILLYTMI